LYDFNKLVVKFAQTEARLNRRSEADPWTAKQGRIFCETLEDRGFRNGRSYAEAYDIFWGTPDAASTELDADTLRDFQGLVHINRGDAVIQLQFSCRHGTAASGPRPAHCSAPTVIEATNHRRFKARAPGTRHRAGVATAANLEKLRTAKRVDDGLEELVMSALSMDSLLSARFIGFAGEHPDISGKTTSRRTIAHDDKVYASVLEPSVGLGAVVDSLIATLEA